MICRATRGLFRQLAIRFPASSGVGARVGTFVTALTCVPLIASPQRISAPPLTVDECNAAVKALESDNRDVTTWRRVNECGAPGAAAIAAALSRSAAEVDTLFLSALLFAGTHIRSRDILNASLARFVDAGSTLHSRVAALLVAAGQYRQGASPAPGWRWGQLLTVPLGNACNVGSNSAGYYSSTTSAPTPADFLQGDAIFRQVIERTSEPAIVRDLALCARYVISPGVQPTIRPELVHLIYECGTRFRIENNNRDGVILRYRVVGTTEQSGIAVPA